MLGAILTWPFAMIAFIASYLSTRSKGNRFPCG